MSDFNLNQWDMVGGAQQKRVTPSPFDFGLWTWTLIVTINKKSMQAQCDCKLSKTIIYATE